MKAVNIICLLVFTTSCTVLPTYRMDSRTYCEKQNYTFVCPNGDVYDAREYKFDNVEYIRTETERFR